MANHYDQIVDALAQKLYEARHPPADYWPSWADLQTTKTYKLRKYRQLADVALRYAASLGPAENAVIADAADLKHA